MNNTDLQDYSHKRLNILTGEWVLVSPHRAKRPWQGQNEKITAGKRPSYDSSCYLCAGNKRINGEINSNYGHLINSDIYYNQYGNVLDELLDNRDSRRASMVYQRPSIWVEYKSNGKNDFICTNAVTYYIRDDELQCVVQMRSNDVVFGYKNDYAWQSSVLNKLVEDFNYSAEILEIKPIKAGSIIWQVQNLHVYERHFHLVK